MCVVRVRLALAFIVLSFNTSLLTAKEIAVDLIYPQVNQFSEQLSLSGTIKSKQDAKVTVLQQGVVAKLFVEAGDHVSAGDTLLELNSSIAKAQYQQALASVEASEIAYQEAERLYQEVIKLSKQQVVAKTLIAERKATRAKALASMSQAKALLAERKEIVNRHTLRAPFSGVIVNRFAEVGEWVTPQATVFSLVANDKLRLELEIPQEYYANFKQTNLVANITPDLQHASQFKANISNVVGATSELSRTFKVFIDIDKSIALIPGISATATIALQQSAQEKLWLPKTAIKHHPDGGYSVFSVTNNVAKRHIVKVIAEQAERIAVTNAPSNHAFVMSGVEALSDGLKVTVSSVKGSAQ